MAKNNSSLMLEPLAAVIGIFAALFWIGVTVAVILAIILIIWLYRKHKKK